MLFAENGSVTNKTWLQYLRHMLPKVDNLENAIVPITDWYAPHLSEIAMSMGLERTISTTLLIGGGTAGVVAVCDQIPHHYLASGYRELYTRHAVVNRGDADRHDAGS